LSYSDETARAALREDAQLLAGFAGRLIRPEADNLVERPWGGDWIRGFKRLRGTQDASALPYGEAFEISACDGDREAAQYPSRVRAGNGSILALPMLLAAHGEALLGADFVKRHGSCFPLLPKTLCVRELLSVQGHPAGNTEVYIIIDAEPGATLRLGFSRDIDAAGMTAALTRGRAQQDELLRLLGAETDVHALQAVLAPWFADRDGGDPALRAWLGGRIAGAAFAAAEELLGELKALYWQTLDSMNAIEVRPGQVIYNATPARLIGDDGVASAEVHALGNPERKQILALEIRRPGPTFRAWDNVRFPQREVDVAAAIAALNLRATRPEEFLCEAVAVAGREGVFVSVDCEFFRVEHLRPAAGQAAAVPPSGPHCLHCLAGAVDVHDASGERIGHLERGESALVPVGVGAYRVAAASVANSDSDSGFSSESGLDAAPDARPDAPPEVVRVSLPEA
jgi:mannose-6-phosphate isomerase class I